MKRKTLILCLVMVLPLLLGTGTAFAANIQYTYDSLNRLIEVNYGNGTAIQYSYDADGNRVKRVIRTAVNGACGSSNGGTFTSAPTSNLCSAGTASSVTGSGPWSWTCQGANGGNDASCSAKLSSTGGLWQNATSTGGGWEYLGPFGFFFPTSSSWIYHQTLGWLYPIGTSTDSIWFYDPQWDGVGGWWWTSSSVFPWVYSNSEGEWLYFDAGDSKPSERWFFTSAGQASTH